jgi:hypothetical protein
MVAPTGRAQRASTRHDTRRARWFGRGLLLGATLALLFAPMPGASLRKQIEDALRREERKSA